MPTTPLWAPRVQDVIGALHNSNKKLIDRVELQSLLGVKKTEAWTLMRRWGALQVGSSLVLSREELLLALRGFVKAASGRNGTGVKASRVIFR